MRIEFRKPASGEERFKKFLYSTTLVYGPPKVGKTTFASTFPNCLIIEAEPHGADYISGWIAEVNSLDDLRALWKELRNMKDAGKLEFDMICLDTIDAIVAWLSDEIAIEFGRRDLSGPSIAYGAEYARLRTETLNLLTQFARLGTGLLLLAHSHEEEGKIALNIPGKLLKRALLAAVNNIIYLGVDEAGRRLCFASPSPALEAGSRDEILQRISPFPPHFMELRRRYLEELSKHEAAKTEGVEKEVEKEAEKEGEKKAGKEAGKVDEGKEEGTQGKGKGKQAKSELDLLGGGEDVQSA